MKQFVIFCAGEFGGLAGQLSADDYLLAADGGLAHLQQLGVTPHEILGDFDSLGFVPRGATVFPVEKDDTDSMLAARRGLELGYRNFLFYGALDGPRLDHTLANLQTLQFLADHGARGYLIGTRSIVTVIREETLCFPEQASGIVSIFCLGPDARGVTLKNLHYPLENGTLTSGFPLGVSNHFIGKPAEISVASGSLVALWDRENGLPNRISGV